jgi:hypothetical protein
MAQTGREVTFLPAYVEKPTTPFAFDATILASI